jgi:orotate phosphoribosyltransferase
MAEANIEWISLTDFDAVTEVAASKGYIAADDIKRLKAFRDDPSDESWIHKG